jgi:eukaryotic-like serine/threonine-protein kinase
VAKPHERIGEVVGQRYELQAVIGQGGQGTVYRALDRWSQSLVAIKIVGAAATDPPVLERLVRELQALNVLQGTAAVKVLDTFRGNDGELCLVLELLIGEDLDQRLYNIRGRERVPPSWVVEILDPIVGTLEVAHAAGILHRDLKPANIFLLQGGGVRLLDFGMARLRKGQPLTAPGTVMGSPSFMAPEAWQGLSDLLDPRADVYSLAVVIFVTLTGELPLTGQTLIEKFLGATQGKHRTLRELRPDLPPAADEWLVRALAMDRNQRFGSVTELWDAFFPAFGVKPPAHRRVSLWARARGAVQRIAGINTPPPHGSATAWTNDGPPTYPREPTPVAVPEQNPGAPPASPPERPVEKTLELHAVDLMPVGPPAPPALPPERRAEKPERRVEKTVSITAEMIVDPITGRAAPAPPPRIKK